MSAPTAEITVRPPPIEPPIFGVRTPGDTEAPDIRAGDMLDIINPLHHIPFVSTLYSEVSGDKAAPIAKLVGGALLGGPIGFIAGLMSVIFEQETGKDVIGAVAAAIGGEGAPSSATRLASAATGVTPEPLPAARPETAVSDGAQTQATVTARPAPARAVTAAISHDSARDQAILSLFGGQTASAHRSYQQAQLRPYLRDVDSSMVL